jgi:hypothetical protein
MLLKMALKIFSPLNTMLLNKHAPNKITFLKIRKMRAFQRAGRQELIRRYESQPYRLYCGEIEVLLNAVEAYRDV